MDITIERHPQKENIVGGPGEYEAYGSQYYSHSTQLVRLP